MAEIARIDLFKEGDRESDLTAKQYVPQHHRAEQDAACLCEEARLAHHEGLDEPPKDHLHDGPIAEIDKTRPGADDQVPMAQHHSPDPPRRARADRAHFAPSDSAP